GIRDDLVTGVQTCAFRSYSKQTMTAVPFKMLAFILGIAMSVGAVFAAMNTMYASVAARTREVGTLRVLGYSRRSIVLGFMLEGKIGRWSCRARGESCVGR